MIIDNVEAHVSVEMYCYYASQFSDDYQSDKFDRFIHNKIIEWLGEYSATGEKNKENCFEHRSFSNKNSEFHNHYEMLPFIETIYTDICEISHRCQNYPYKRMWISYPKGQLYNKGKCILDDEHNHIEIIYDEPCYDFYDTMAVYQGEYCRVFSDEHTIRFYILSMSEKPYFNCFGGAVLIYIKDTKELRYFCLGEDDGWIFPETYYFERYWKFDDIKMTDYECARFCSYLGNVYSTE